MQSQLAVALAIAVAIPFGGKAAVHHPTAEIANESVRATIYLPDASTGFYQGTRFDWAGVVSSLKAHGHDYYGPWFNKTDPAVHDFVYRGDDIVAGPCSAITGPVDEFAPLSFDDAKPGETFVKIGVGALKKPSADKYDNYHVYEIANGGKWEVHPQSAAVEFIQTLNDPNSGYAYVYRKRIELPKGKSGMILSHSLRNSGKRAIHTSVYNHNFLVLDHQPTGPGFTISVPFSIQTPQPPKPDLAKVAGETITYVKTLQGEDTVATPINGFGPEAAHNSVRIENHLVGAGLSWHTDRPLLRESLWSIRSVIAVEPFVAIDIEPGAEFTWQTVYDYFTVTKSPR